MVELAGLAGAAAWAMVAALLVPLAIYCLELLAGLRSTTSHTAPAAASRTAILIPAHDEAVTIGDTLAQLSAERNAGVRIVVVADNCSDDTAAIARRAGAEVVERHDETRRGKGYALAAGRDYLAGGGVPPQVVIVLDADCRLLPGSAATLAAAASAGNCPVQAVNLIEADLNAPPMIQISNFAMVVKNLFRSRGMQRLGGGALLTGTGMAFPWPLFARARLATGSIVEDLNLGIELTREGYTPRLIGTAHVRSKAASMNDALAQRMRWEHGFLSTLRQSALPLLGQGLAKRSAALFLLGLHLLVPPLALLIGAALAVLLLLTAMAQLTGALAPAVVLASAIATALTLTLCAWAIAGRPYLAGSTLLKLPSYLAWKLPLYRRFFAGQQTTWNRTPRHPNDR